MIINRELVGRMTHVIYADSVADVAEFLKTPRKWRQCASERETASASWDLNAGYDGAWRMAREGWSQGAADLHAAVQAIEPEGAMPTHRYDFGGERVDVPRFLGGAMDCMVTRGRGHKQKPIVHLVVNGTVSCGVGAKAIAAYGAALTAIIDKLERSGRRVVLDILYTITFRGNGGGATGIVGWNVKRAEDHCDMSAIAFAVAHPAAFRRIAFAMMERLPASFEDHTYGHPSVPSKLMLESLDMGEAFLMQGVGAQGGDLDPTRMVKFCASQINAEAGEEIISVEE